MFLKKSLEKKLHASLSQYEEDKVMEKKIKSNHHLSRTDKLNYALDHRLFNEDAVSENVIFL